MPPRSGEPIVDWRLQLEWRLRPQPLTFDRIAELHACQALGATEPAGGAASHRRGHDVLFEGGKVEIKSKTPSHRQRAASASYIIVTATKLEVADLFWFYLFGGEADDLEVFEMGANDVAARLRDRGAHRVIYLHDVRDGRCIWRHNRPVSRTA